DVGTMADLLEAYPELIAHVGDYDAMMGAMTDRHGVLTDQMKDNIYQQALQHENAKLAEQENEATTQQAKADMNAAYTEVAGDNEDGLLGDNADRAKTDTDNAFEKETTKEGYTQERASSEDKAETDVTNAKSEHYETDNKNFNELANSKESQEGSLINRLRETRSGYIGWVAQKINSWWKGVANALPLGLGDHLLKEEFDPAPDVSSLSIGTSPDLTSRQETTQG